MEDSAINKLQTQEMVIVQTPGDNDVLGIPFKVPSLIPVPENSGHLMIISFIIYSPSANNSPTFPASHTFAI